LNEQIDPYPIGVAQSNPAIFTSLELSRYIFGFVEADRGEHLKMIPGGSQPPGDMLFSIKGLGCHSDSWACSISERRIQLHLPVIAFWLLDAWYLRQERLFRRLYDDVRCKEGVADFSMDIRPFRNSVGSLMQVAFSRTIILFYGPVFLAVLLLEFLLPQKAR
jgi:hypothetical protein